MYDFIKNTTLWMTAKENPLPPSPISYNRIFVISLANRGSETFNVKHNLKF